MHNLQDFAIQVLRMQEERELPMDISKVSAEKLAGIHGCLYGDVPDFRSVENNPCENPPPEDFRLAFLEAYRTVLDDHSGLPHCGEPQSVPPRPAVELRGEGAAPLVRGKPVTPLASAPSFSRTPSMSCSAPSSTATSAVLCCEVLKPNSTP